MPIREIVIYPDSRLRQSCEAVSEVDSQIRELFQDMAETMYKAPGIGLAGPQIGVLKRLIVVDVQEGLGGEGEREQKEQQRQSTLYKMANPQIVKRDGSVIGKEGCLSIPGLNEKVERDETITLSYIDENNKRQSLTTSGLLSICIQHEIDHIDGVLFIDRLSPLRKQKVKNKLKRLAREKKAKNAETKV